MAKLTNGHVLDMLKSTCNVQDWKTWNDPKGDKERTKINHLIALCCVKDCINTISVFEAVYPDGVAAAIEKYKDKFEQFRQKFIQEYPDDFIAYSLTIDLAPIGATKYNFKKDPPLEVEKFAGKQQEAEVEQKQSEYNGLTLRELRKLCRERDITVPTAAKAEDLVALLEEQDESGEQPSDNQEEPEQEASEEEEEVKPAPKAKPAKKVEEPEDEEEDLEEPEEPTPKKKPVKKVEEPEPKEDEETEEEQPEQTQPAKEEESEEEDVEEASPYDEMEIEELRAECDKRGIEYKKNTKAHVLIDLLTAADKRAIEQEDEDQKEADELDDLLDENFVDEEIEAVAQEENEVKSAKAKKNKR